MLVTPGTSRWPEMDTIGSVRCCRRRYRLRSRPRRRAAGDKRVLLDKISAVTVADNRINVALFQEEIFNARHHERGVTFADLRHNGADCETAFLTEGARHQVGTVIQFTSRFPDSLLGHVGNGFCTGRSVYDQRHGCRGNTQILGKLLRTDGTRAISGISCGCFLPDLDMKGKWILHRQRAGARERKREMPGRK